MWNKHETLLIHWKACECLVNACCYIGWYGEKVKMVKKKSILAEWNEEKRVGFLVTQGSPRMNLRSDILQVPSEILTGNGQKSQR